MGPSMAMSAPCCLLKRPAAGSWVGARGCCHHWQAFCCAPACVKPQLTNLIPINDNTFPLPGPERQCKWGRLYHCGPAGRGPCGGEHSDLAPQQGGPSAAAALQQGRAGNCCVPDHHIATAAAGQHSQRVGLEGGGPLVCQWAPPERQERARQLWIDWSCFGSRSVRRQLLAQLVASTPCRCMDCTRAVHHRQHALTWAACVAWPSDGLSMAFSLPFTGYIVAATKKLKVKPSNHPMP